MDASGVGEAINSGLTAELSGPREYECPWTNRRVEETADRAARDALTRTNGPLFLIRVAAPRPTVMRRSAPFTPLPLSLVADPALIYERRRGRGTCSMIERRFDERVALLEMTYGRESLIA